MFKGKVDYIICIFSTVTLLWFMHYTVHSAVSTLCNYCKTVIHCNTWSTKRELYSCPVKWTCFLYHRISQPCSSTSKKKNDECSLWYSKSTHYSVLSTSSSCQMNRKWHLWTWSWPTALFFYETLRAKSWHISSASLGEETSYVI